MRPGWAPDVLTLFLELAALPSPPGEERAVADRVLDYLRALGLEADEDDAGSRIGSSIGNIHCRLPSSNGAVGTPLILGAPHQRKLDVHFRGRAAHAGMYPEEGRSAIAAAARAIADLRLGRLDDETSANVGQIEGGTARNIVPERCSFLAEARSHDER